MENWENDLEDMVDGHTLSGVLSALAEICYGKAQHLEENWQDKISAKTWIQAGKKIENLSPKIEV